MDEIVNNYTDAPSTSIIARQELGVSMFGLRQMKLRSVTIEKRLSDPKVVQRMTTLGRYQTWTSSVDIHQRESEFLLCGSAMGNIDIINLNSEFDPLLGPRKTAITTTERIQILVCQWYSQSIEFFITASRDDKVTLWDVNKQQKAVVIDCDCSDQAHWNEHDDDHPLVAVCGKSTHIKLLDLRVARGIQDVRNKSEVSTVRWMPVKQHILASGDTDGVCKFWDIRSGRKSLAERALPIRSHLGAIRFSSDGLWMVLVENNLKKIHLFDALNLRLVITATLLPLQDVRRGHLKMACNNFAVIDEGKFLRVAIPFETSLAWITFDPDPVEPSYSIKYLSGHVGNVTVCAYRTGFQELYSMSLGTMLCWGPESERVRVSVENEKRRREAEKDDWDSDDDSSNSVRLPDSAIGWGMLPARLSR